MMKKLSIGISIFFILLMISFPSVVAEEVLSFADEVGDVLDATTGKQINSPNIDIYLITATQSNNVIDLRLRLASGGNIQNSLAFYYQMNLTTDKNSYLVFYGGGQIGVTDKDGNDIAVDSYTGVGTNILTVKFNLYNSNEVCLNLTAATYEFSGESEQGYYDECTNKIEIINVEIDCPSSSTVGNTVLFYGNTDYNDSDLKWSWDFGDGGVSDLSSPTHTYNNAGSFKVSLVVTDLNETAYGFDSKTISINKVQDEEIVINVDAGGPYKGIISEPVQFYGNTSYTDSDLDWSWDFGDGTSSNLKSPTHTYNETGIYYVSLSASGPSGTIPGHDTTTVTINKNTGKKVRIKIRVEAGGPYNGTVGKPVQFYGTAEANTSDLEWYWGFKDVNESETSDVKNPKYTYNEPGTYEVVLNVFNSTGYGYDFTNVTINPSTSQVDNKNEKKTTIASTNAPGFELIIVICAIIVVLSLLIWMKDRNK